MPNSNKKKRDLSRALAHFYKKPVTKVSLEFFLSIIAILFFALFAIRPTLVTMSELVKEIEDKKELASQLQRKIVALSSAQEEYQRLESEIVMLNQSIPVQPELLEALKILEKLAGEEDIVIDTIALQEIPEEDPLTNLTYEEIEARDLYLTETVIGDYPSIKDYVAAIQAMRRSFMIEEIDFLVDEQNQQETLKANLTIRIPYFGDKNAKSVQTTTK
jgi:Tfp pilus assembly protein PilO